MNEGNTKACYRGRMYENDEVEAHTLKERASICFLSAINFHHRIRYQSIGDSKRSSADQMPQAIVSKA